MNKQHKIMKQKKNYIKPEIQVVELEACSVLAASPGEVSVDPFGNDEDLGSYEL